jgi:hypothetical protein
MLDEVEKRGLGPLEIVEHDHERLLASKRLEQFPHRPGDFLRRGAALGLADRIERSVDDPPGLGLALEELDESLLIAQLLENLDQRPVGDSLAVREAASGQDCGLISRSPRRRGS